MKIEEIKEQLKMSAVLAHYGLKVNKNKHINCPFHDDKTPSMRFYAETDTVYCFSGNCETHGHSLDVIEFVMKMENCSKHQAILICKKLLGHVVPLKQQNLTVHEQLWRVMKKSLQGCSKAKSYLKTRGLGTNGVGYNSGLLAKGKCAPLAQELGLVNWGNSSVVYSLRNALGQVVSFYARGLAKGHFYQSNRSGLYPCYPRKTAKKIVLTESIIDAHSLAHIQVFADYEVLALFGTNGLTKEHEKALLACKELEEVILMLDGDGAGEKASKKYQVLLSKLLPNTKIKIVALPKDTDVNELWSNHLSEDLFKELLASVKEAKPKLDTSTSHNLRLKIKGIEYAVKGFAPLKNLDSMKVTIVCTREGNTCKSKIELYNLNSDPSEKKNLASQQPEKVLELKNKATDIVLNGRTTPGSPQLNDTKYWNHLTWITQEEYKTKQGAIK